jgi:tRNA-specific 2-thiouridylase
VVGKHVGLSFYTIGQRQGLAIGGQGLPWFVADKDMADNKLIVVQGHEHPLLLKPELTAMEMHWISGNAPDTSRDYAAKTRYRQEDAPCRIALLNDGNTRFSFATPQWAVTPGQSVVAYDGVVCLGGGIIL